jgi:hypothetical protein
MCWEACRLGGGKGGPSFCGARVGPQHALLSIQDLVVMLMAKKYFQKTLVLVLWHERIQAEPIGKNGVY